MKIEETPLDGALVITPDRFQDQRGFFSETYVKKNVEEALGGVEFVQDNHSYSKSAGTLRGLHYQEPPFDQAKLVRCTRGSIFDVAVDFRQGSITYGEWYAEELSAENGKQLFVPQGFLHGFLTLEDDTEVLYKCSNYYAPSHDRTIAWDSANILWPIEGQQPIISEKDAAAPAFQTVDCPFSLEACA
ncbi:MULTISPECIES: dTDP-4-dehydrorhamnose 3,5-epimerase [Halocynthiibacter]|uniref:dTDP-4-dehydrorhamnose 3,5-epimerase n=1 Tax=Halocynthiibacter halioticoli TaxID=2986804 RepID=A0AAE3IW67_9RHOB|nr:MULTISPECIES: dTDP-4-dehydrorhamnose 3,5-epimerase [Halocynthiibacter]MCV6823104.1 dTDP-4-dehydrorhamnose 3,5-epimerase [Halocynthiibacter halioticoli]MCW4056105.1 dTDP-4-dehydrorhamnose 3,5-epimerase [Halocynthiibacter sp. SDUM655004]